VMLRGMSSLAVVCHLARSSSSTAWAPSATWPEISSRDGVAWLGVGEGVRKRDPDAADGTNGAEQIGAVVVLIGGSARPRSRRAH
jgi:hypothetical protein